MIPRWYLFDCSAWRTRREKLVKVPTEVAGADVGEVALVLGEKPHLSVGRK